MHEFAPQTLPTVGQGFKFLVGHGAQPGEYRPFSGGKAMQGRVFKNRPGRFRDEGTPRPALQHETSYRRGGGIFMVGRPVVIAPLPPDGKGNHGGALGENGLAVFHGQNVVGAAQNLPGQPHLRESLGAGGGEGLAAVQFPAKEGREVLRKQRPGSLHQRRGFAGLRAEAKGVAQL